MAKQSTKMWYESRTVWFNVLGLVVVVAQYLLQQNLVDPKVVETVMAVVNVALRLVTTEKIDRSLT